MLCRHMIVRWSLVLYSFSCVCFDLCFLVGLCIWFCWNLLVWGYWEKKYTFVLGVTVLFQFKGVLHHLHLQHLIRDQVMVFSLPFEKVNAPIHSLFSFVSLVGCRHPHIPLLNLLIPPLFLSLSMRLYLILSSVVLWSRRWLLWMIMVVGIWFRVW